jgi:hypothetical protein
MAALTIRISLTLREAVLTDEKANGQKTTREREGEGGRGRVHDDMRLFSVSNCCRTLSRYFKAMRLLRVPQVQWEMSWEIEREGGTEEGKDERKGRRDVTIAWRSSAFLSDIQFKGSVSARPESR